jgi:hypothetical protein
MGARAVTFCLVGRASLAGIRAGESANRVLEVYIDLEDIFP